MFVLYPRREFLRSDSNNEFSTPRCVRDGNSSIYLILSYPFHPGLYYFFQRLKMAQSVLDRFFPRTFSRENKAISLPPGINDHEIIFKTLHNHEFLVHTLYEDNIINLLDHNPATTTTVFVVKSDGFPHAICKVTLTSFDNGLCIEEDDRKNPFKGTLRWEVREREDFHNSGAYHLLESITMSGDPHLCWVSRPGKDNPDRATLKLMELLGRIASEMDNGTGLAQGSGMGQSDVHELFSNAWKAKRD